MRFYTDNIDYVKNINLIHEHYSYPQFSEP